MANKKHLKLAESEAYGVNKHPLTEENRRLQAKLCQELGIEPADLGSYILALGAEERKKLYNDGKLIDLSKAKLVCDSLHSTDFSLADLSGAVFCGSYFPQANFFGANLSGANLYDANCPNANLSQANLSEASLSKADFSRANLRNANLRGADLSETNLFFTDLCGADLRGAKNLEFAKPRRTLFDRNTKISDSAPKWMKDLHAAAGVEGATCAQWQRADLGGYAVSGTLVDGKFVELGKEQHKSAPTTQVNATATSALLKENTGLKR